jgi:D-3-phosphoglycerate dehydrogenase / 2-oxoglutarate reductase
MANKLRVAIAPSSFAQEDDTPLKLLEQAGCEVVPNPYSRRLTQDEIIAHLNGVHGLIAGLEPLNRTVLESAPELKALARVGIGMTNVDQTAAEAFGIAVSNTPDGPVDAVAEMTLTALLAILRNLVPANDALHQGTWEKRIGRSINGSRVLIVGYGRIGRRVGEILGGLGADWKAFDLICSDIPENRIASDLHSGLAWADVVSLHASGDTCLLGTEEFAAMKSGTILLNSARGELVDEAALCAALDAGTVASGWFDAFVQEPYSGPLTRYPQMLLTPHMSTYTRDCRLYMERTAVENLLRDLGVTP